MLITQKLRIITEIFYHYCCVLLCGICLDALLIARFIVDKPISPRLLKYSKQERIFLYYIYYIGKSNKNQTN